MSKKIIYKCDNCGKKIKENEMKFTGFKKLITLNGEKNKEVHYCKCIYYDKLDEAHNGKGDYYAWECCG